MQKEKLEKDLINGDSISDLVKKYEKSYTTIRYWLKKFNLKTKYKSFSQGFEGQDKPSNKKTFKSSAVDLNWILIQKEYDEGATWRDICKKFNINYYQIQIAKSLNLFKSRTLSEARKISEELGKINRNYLKTDIWKSNVKKNGGLRQGAGRCKKFEYDSIIAGTVFLDGTWELKFAQYLDSQKILWTRNKESFRYIFKEKEYKYYPDFYLVNTEEYVEIKGYKTERDEAKWNQFPKKLTILRKTDLQQLNINLS